MNVKRGYEKISHCLFLLLIGFVVLPGCGEDRENSGEAISAVIIKVGTSAAPARIGDILADPADYLGRMVRLEGKIVWECPDGCELHLQDETAR